MGDKLKIKLSVANRIYPLTIDPSQEEGLRLASQQINTLIKKFEQNYSVRDKQDALAMCALQIASSKKQNSLNEETFINDQIIGVDPKLAETLVEKALTSNCFPTLQNIKNKPKFKLFQFSRKGFNIIIEEGV